MKMHLCSLAAILLSASSAVAQPPGGAPVPGAPAGPPLSAAAMAERAIMGRTDQAIVQVKPNLYMIIGDGGNSTVRVTPAGVLLVDDKNPGDDIYAELLSKIAGVTQQPAKTVVNTHAHADHSGNNARFLAAGANIISYNSPSARMAPQRPGSEAPVAANDPMTDEVRTVTLGGAQAQLIHLGDAHTDSDVVVLFPDLKVVATGDAYVAITPGVMYPDGGRLIGTQQAMAKLLTYDFDTVIPGHGNEPVPRAKIVAFKAEIETLIARSRAAIRAGAARENLLSKVDGSGLSWELSGRMWSNPVLSGRIYDELTANP